MLNDANARAVKPGDKAYKLTDSIRLFLLVHPPGISSVERSADLGRHGCVTEPQATVAIDDRAGDEGGGGA